MRSQLRSRLILSFLISLAPTLLLAQNRTKIQWQVGPTIGRLGDVAQINVPEGYRFAGRSGALKVEELTQNPADGKELGVIIPDPKHAKDIWFAIFEFNKIGYVKDEQKDSLDSNAILESIEKATTNSNTERQSKGWPSVFVTGWTDPPFYNSATHNLTWATQGYSNDPKFGRQVAINYSVRILGRNGAMSADLVISPSQEDTAIPQFESVLTGFSFDPGQTYADFRPGDKVAKYGLTGLILGGAVVAAAKTGLLAKFWKLLVVVAAAVFSAIAKFFRYLKRLLTGKASEEEPATQG